MPLENAKLEMADRDSAVAWIANTIAEQAYMLAGTNKISRMDLCCSLANAIGFILADAAKPDPNRGGKARALPKANALERMDHLRTIIETAYEIRTAEGTEQ